MKAYSFDPKCTSRQKHLLVLLYRFDYAKSWVEGLLILLYWFHVSSDVAENGDPIPSGSVW